MPPRFLLLPITLAMIAGCAAPNNYDQPANPFDEPAKPVAARTAPAPPPAIKNPIAARAALPEGLPERDISQNSAVAVAVAPDQPLVTTHDAGQEPPHIKEMLDEADRLGKSGDVQGKADLLMQVGYSGNAKRFYDLARMYLDGSLPRDMPKAVEYITLANDRGYVETSRVLGLLYLRGEGVPEDARYGRLLLERASETSPRASREYGQMLANLSHPELNDPDRGITYLRQAYERGDNAALPYLTKALERAGRLSEAPSPLPPTANEAAITPADQPQITDSFGSSLKTRAMRGNPQAVFQYAQQIMLRKVKSPEPEFQAYCWLSVANQLGSAEAAQELSLISGVRTISDRKNPGRLDQCITDLHYQISGN